jgi:predicted O-methyltransferase YrrM
MDTVTVPVFTEDWFGEASQEALADLYRRVAHLDGDIVEVGSWEGRSTIVLANAAAPALVHAVDTWEGSPGEISAGLAAERDVYATFVANIEAATAGNVEAHRSDWRAYFADHRAPVRFVFIDAAHTYEEVADNIAAVLPLLVRGGIICGDDMHHRPVREAVLALLPDAQAIATLWCWQKPTLAERYRQLCSTPSDIYEHLPTFVRLVERLDAQHVIELGTRTGVSTVAWLYGLDKTGGRLTSVDIDPAPDIGGWPHWTFRQSDDLAPELLAELEPADIVFIDTSHQYDHTLMELHVYRHLVRSGGLLVCHDTELARPQGTPPGDPQFPVKRAIEAFCRAEQLDATFDLRCWGLATIEVP